MSRIMLQSEDVPSKQDLELAIARLRRMQEVLASYQIQSNAEERRALQIAANFLEMISKQR